MLLPENLFLMASMASDSMGATENAIPEKNRKYFVRLPYRKISNLRQNRGTISEREENGN